MVLSVCFSSGRSADAPEDEVNFFPVLNIADMNSEDTLEKAVLRPRWRNGGIYAMSTTDGLARTTLWETFSFSALMP